MHTVTTVSEKKFFVVAFIIIFPFLTFKYELCIYIENFIAKFLLVIFLILLTTLILFSEIYHTCDMY